jgi:hypothetical protein
VPSTWVCRRIITLWVSHSCATFHVMMQLDLDAVDASGPFIVLAKSRQADQLALAAEDFGPGVPPLGSSAPPPSSWRAVPPSSSARAVGHGSSVPRPYGGGGAPPQPVAATSLNIASPSLAYLFEKPADDFIAMLLNVSGSCSSLHGRTPAEGDLSTMTSLLILRVLFRPCPPS